MYLHKTSSYPPHTKKKLPYGLVLRNKRICFDPDDFEKRKCDIKRRFRLRGYNRREAKYQLQGTEKKTRTVRNRQLQEIK